MSEQAIKILKDWFAKDFMKKNNSDPELKKKSGIKQASKKK